jgi:hypothetical protein
MNKSPEQLNELYMRGVLSTGEFLGRLIGCARYCDVPAVIGVLGEPEREKLKEFVMRCSMAETDDDFGSVNGPPLFLLADVRKFEGFFKTPPK